MQQYPEIYDYHDNKNCYLYHDKFIVSIFSYYLDYLTVVMHMHMLYV